MKLRKVICAAVLTAVLSAAEASAVFAAGSGMYIQNEMCGQRLLSDQTLSAASGWKTVNGKTYYYVNGKKVTGAKKIAGKTYVFTAKGVLVKNKKVYKSGSNYYKITKTGIATRFTGVSLLAAKRLLDKSTVNMNLKKAFKWSAMEFFAVAPPSSTKESKIAEYYGKFGFSNHRGNCYVQAYTFYWMAKLLGQNVKVIRGYIKKTTGLDSHAWCEIKDSSGTIWVYDPNFNSEYSSRLNNPDAGYKFKYGAKKTLQYYDAKKKAKS